MKIDRTRHLFVAPDSTLRDSWLEAFPDASLCTQLPAKPEADVIWMLLPEEGDYVSPLVACRIAVGNTPIVAMSDLPSDPQGLAALGAGVVGYCNGHAAPSVLRQVSDTVQNGGLWIGQWLMQKLLASVSRAAAQKFPTPDPSVWASELTQRELEVAQAAATGLGNKEIAIRLNITERTVKAHMGSIFDKLKLRDRMHLTLLVNGIVNS